MNNFQKWVRSSREQQRRAPERYLVSYPELIMDDKSVMMTKETFDKIERHCGRYDGTLPTGEYLGKMFLRGDCLCWFGIDKERALTHIKYNSRIIMIIGG